MPEQQLKEASRSMDRTVEAMRREFNTVRTGKATPTLLDTVRVQAYGSTMALNQVANVGAPEPQLLVVQPYDPNVAGEIAKAIQTADLGLNPSVDGGVIRVPIPPLTEERRREYVKVLHKMAEEGRIAIRHVRQETKNRFHQMERNGEISEDLYHRWLDELQKLTDGHIAEIDALLERKEAEVMEV
ncbi:MAG: ribosome recycling factor [Gemmatimonadota bacterium]